MGLQSCPLLLPVRGSKLAGLWASCCPGYFGLISTSCASKVTVLVSHHLTKYSCIWQLLHPIQADQGLPDPEQNLQGRADAHRALLPVVARLNISCLHVISLFNVRHITRLLLCVNTLGIISFFWQHQECPRCCQIC